MNNENIQQNHQTYLEVRRNILRTFFNFIKTFIWTIFTYSFSVTSIILLVLNYNKTCDKSLYTWLIFASISFLLHSILSTYLKFVSPNNNEEQQNNNLSFVSLLQHVITILFLILFIIACIYIFNTKTCDTEMKQVYIFTIIFMIIIFIIFTSFCWIPLLLAIIICITYPCYPFLENITNYILNINPENPATKDDLKKLHIFKYNKVSKNADFVNQILPHNNNILTKNITEPTCCICLQNYENNDLLRILPCNDQHNFHLVCIDKWLKINKKCPLCRIDIINTYIV